MTYRERLHIPWWWVLIGILFVGSIALVVAFSTPLPVAIAMTALTILGVGLGLLAYSATAITVGDGVLTVGRNRLEAGYIGDVDALAGADARAGVGPEADHRAFLFTRPYINDVVRVHLRDEADPHPYWLVSTRRPAELADAIKELTA